MQITPATSCIHGASVDAEDWTPAAAPAAAEDSGDNEAELSGWLADAMWRPPSSGHFEPGALDKTYFIVVQMAHSIKLPRGLSQASFVSLSFSRADWFIWKTTKVPPPTSSAATLKSAPSLSAASPHSQVWLFYLNPLRTDFSCNHFRGKQTCGGFQNKNAREDYTLRRRGNFAGLLSKPGKTVRRLLLPRCMLTISPRTERKSVVNARSRPSFN